MSIEHALFALSERKLALVNPDKWEDRNDVYFVDMYKSCVNAASLYAACFTTSPERNHHWNSFSAKDGSICLVFNKKKFTRYFDNHHAEILKGHVAYMTTATLKSLVPLPWPDLPFIKRYGFIDEEEYRIIRTGQEDQKVVDQINMPQEILEKIILCPNIPAYLERALKRELGQLNLPATIRIERSTLPDDQRFKEAGLTASF